MQQIFSIPDIHGDTVPALEALALAGLTDGKGRWMAPPGTILVQTGDLFDRGDDTKGVFEIMRSLERSAAEAGSRVHRLLGNHDVTNLLGDTPYVTTGDASSFGGHVARARAFSADGEIGDSVPFVHAGIHPNWARLGCHGINSRAATELALPNTPKPISARLYRLNRTPAPRFSKKSHTV